MVQHDAAFSFEHGRRSQFEVLTAVAVALTLLCTMWAFADQRTVGDAEVWAKPLKFAISFTLLFGTIALVESRLSARVRQGLPMRIIGFVMAAAFLSEMAYMIYQAARAEPSHFNVSTPFHRLMYEGVMAAGAVALVAGTAAIGWLARNDRQAELADGVRAGIWLGFLLSFILTMVVAGYLSINGSHHVGVHPADGPVVPLIGWSGVTGDLRPAHFLSLHAMQILPIVGWIADRGNHARPGVTVASAAALYSFLTLAIFAQALLERPLLPMLPMLPMV